MPALPATWPDLRERVQETLADPGCATWLALHDGHILGFQIFETPASARWDHSPMVVPDRSLYLFMAATAPEARSLGVGAALLDRSMRWARSAGFERCTLHFLPASRASFFWQGLGFRPYLHELRRLLDPRVLPDGHSSS
jgi:GNAT superfamily N-acetyltransferase